MKKIIITVSGYTSSQRLKNLLLRAKIKAKQIKLDNTQEGLGCVHGIEISERDFYPAVVIMRENKINYSILSERGEKMNYE